MKPQTSETGEPAALLTPRTLSGALMDYTFCDDKLVIIDKSPQDTARRRVEVPWCMLGRFVSEMQEIERLAALSGKPGLCP